MRPVWKGHIRFSLVTIPVRVYNAVDTAKELSFNLLHKEDNGRVGYEKKCKKCGEKLATDDIVKGYEYEPDQYVLIEKEDLEKVRLKTTRVAEVQGFVARDAVDPVMVERPYYLGPDGSVAAGPYALLVKTLLETNTAAIAKVVIRDREDAVMIAPDTKGEGLVMYILRAPEQVRAIASVPGLEEKKSVAAAELKLASALVEQMATTLGDIDLDDRYSEAVHEMIQAKVKGREVVMVGEEDERPAVDIMTALRQSIDTAKAARKPMATARGKAKAKKTQGEESEPATTTEKDAAKAPRRGRRKAS